MPPPLSERSVFIVRIWRESDGAIRGSLQTTPAGELRYFATLADLLTLLQTMMEISPADESEAEASAC